MAKYYKKSKEKIMIPTFFVFCEGESEEAYISFLKKKYRLSSVKISPKIAGNKINKKFIDNYLKDKSRHPKDKNFLIYDFDVPAVNERLKSIKDTIFLASNPCFEIWYILHYVNHSKSINSNECVEKIENLCKDYAKGIISTGLKEKIDEHQNKAIERAKKLKKYENPSTTVYLFIEEIEKNKK